ncbi:uncharacterized protein NECHADRAFT_97350 [Fusarium vanettenii 77-13-4]|uniref:Indole-diterpene biosynthesis protein PaxU n=1 Tax=Fusarium vanettenii (strain ATCC MYA-4622 / CBS 123669 / FGSC 9596 / NRRL 45880 / 77-13-4) TaxID=660122 RepID=C7ZK32_FUSV7|nr:uncharacterized protein NECHADRAFT_97350 [Fusarium vanettenii 77-13-4]EEU35607.1 hypothetical protein NECHADRAFT_97350 [Fusarium vanettenii 77-13-4]
MASNTKPAKESPLSFMEKLSPEVFLYRPSSSTDSGDPAHPKLIIVASWTNALDGHIAKYIEKYKIIYPSSPIVLVKSTSKILFNPPLLRKAIEPMVPAVKACLPADASSSPSPSLLIHMLSNGGSSSISNLYDAYAASVGENEDPHLPPHVTICDSCPGWESVGGLVAFLQVGLSGVLRLVATPFMYLVGVVWVSAITVGLAKDWITVWRKTHNDKENKNPYEIRRTYIYSEKDTMIDYKAIESHADEAEKVCFQVRREKFDGSSHVAHSRHDEARYWGAVTQTWEGR